MSKTKKCQYCGIQHKNKGRDLSNTEIIDTCFICAFLINSLFEYVAALNQFVPTTTGKNNRKLHILKFEIVKVNATHTRKSKK